MDKLKLNLHAIFGKKYNVNETKKMYPRIILHNVDNEAMQMDDGDLSKEIVDRNELNEFDSEIHLKIVRRINLRNNSKVVIEVEPFVRDIILRKKHLFVG